MKIRLSTARLRAIYTEMGCESDFKGNSKGWIRGLFKEMRAVISAPTLKEAIHIVRNWGSPEWAAKEIRRLARKRP